MKLRLRFHLLRNLYLAHRWLGIAIGVLVLCWFASGVVMMYVPYPHLDDAERRAALTPLETSQTKVTATAAWQATKEQGAPDSVRLANLATTNAKRPAYVFIEEGKWHVVWADDGTERTSVTAAEAAAAAQAMRPGRVIANEKIDVDQWSLGGLDAHRPLYRVELNDAANSILYVSSRTGEVVRDTDRVERGWNWVGSVIHWIYFTPLRVARQPWRQVVMWFSATAFSLALTGTTVGILRLRLRRRYSHNRITPYGGWQRWHHLLGLAMALSALMWLFSGWLSVNPFSLFEFGGITRADRIAVADGELGLTDLSVSVPALLARSAIPVVEIEWSRFDGQGYLRLHRLHNQGGTLVSARDFQPAVFSPAQLIAAAQRLRPGLAIIDTPLLADGDLYYYRHHNEKPLPVLRVDFADEKSTSFYLDPATGRIADYADSNGRLYRWLFNGLHQLDFPFLIRHRPAWDIAVIALCLCGALLSLSGLVIGWRRLRK